MPLYHYLCQDCNKEFEIRHRYKEEGIICIHCESTAIKKHLGNAISVVKKSNIVKDKKVGTEVHEAIQDGKEELMKTKEELTQKARTE
tara:strand:+ start:4526 stop:4789 length:264 start_codon:yes stop_codon:yes gene_type:complete